LIALPVEAGTGSGYGDGLETMRGLNAQNQYNLTVVEPDFGLEPWYADNPSNVQARQESFLTSEFMPWVKQNLASTNSEQTWLIGFSKSGMGTDDLILKHPDLFQLAAMWDFPTVGFTSYDQFGASSMNSYGTNANFQANYELTNAFLQAHKSPFLSAKRLWIGGFNAFQSEVANYDAVLAGLGMQHDTETPTNMLHRWDSGWVQLALASLYADSLALPTPTPSPTPTPAPPQRQLPHPHPQRRAIDQSAATALLRSLPLCPHLPKHPAPRPLPALSPPLALKRRRPPRTSRPLQSLDSRKSSGLPAFSPPSSSRA
jgi:hypothetical protein